MKLDVNRLKSLPKVLLLEKRGLLAWMGSYLWTMVRLMVVPTKVIRESLSLLLALIRFMILLKPLILGI